MSAADRVTAAARFAWSAWQGITWKQVLGAFLAGIVLMLVMTPLMMVTLMSSDNLMPEFRMRDNSGLDVGRAAREVRESIGRSMEGDMSRIDQAQSRAGNLALGSSEAVLLVPFVLLLLLKLVEHGAAPRRPDAKAYVAIALVVGLAFLVNVDVVIGVGTAVRPTWGVLWMSSQLLLIIGLGVFVYARLRGAADARQRLARAEIARNEESRRVLNARLKAIQAQVEPRFLFNTLEEIQRSYERDRQIADGMMDDLIAYLRAALPQIRQSSSTLGGELELARTYLRIAARLHGAALRVEAEAPPSLFDAPFPPMVMLPVAEVAIERWKASEVRPASIRIEARARHDGGIAIFVDEDLVREVVP